MTDELRTLIIDLDGLSSAKVVYHEETIRLCERAADALRRFDNELMDQRAANDRLNGEILCTLDVLGIDRAERELPAEKQRPLDSLVSEALAQCANELAAQRAANDRLRKRLSRERGHC